MSGCIVGDSSIDTSSVRGIVRFVCGDESEDGTILIMNKHSLKRRNYISQQDPHACWVLIV
jgi:hypothetical protein